jgi:hypothetical protein
MRAVAVRSDKAAGWDRYGRPEQAQRSSGLRLPALLFVFLWAAGVSSAAPPAAVEKPAEPTELRYRRVYFPEGTKDWPKGNVKYLPMEAAEFERLIEIAQRTAPGGPGQTSVGLVDAQYEGRLTGQNLLKGSARLDVSPSITSSMLMTLSPCNLAISRAQWVTSDGAPAVLGLTADGKLQAVAERSGQMKFDWSLAGQRDASGVATFRIALPPSPLSRLRLDLPAALVPSVDRGIVTDEGPAELGFHRWKLDLGGRPGCELRLANAGSEEARPQPVLASQASTYDFSLRGVEVTVALNIEGRHAALQRLALPLDASLELVEVALDDEPLPWSISASGGGKPRRATIVLPPARQQGAARLRLRAMAPLVLASSWKLPRIDFDGIVCVSDTMRLSVESPLCVDRLEADSRVIRQTGLASLAKSAGEQLDFETFTPDAGIEISLALRPAEIRAVSATATQLGQGKMSSRVATDFRAGDGVVFSLEADVLPNWTIDSVESQPGDGLDDWSLERRGDARKLSVRLARPLTADRPLRLIVSARRLYVTPGRNLGVDDVVPLRFLLPGTPPAAPGKPDSARKPAIYFATVPAALSETRRWVDLRPTGSNELHFTSGEHFRRVDLKDLTAAEIDLFAEPPGEFLFRDDAGAAGLRLSLENRRPTYSGDIHVEAIAGDGLLKENYLFVCTPSKSAPMDRVVVHFCGHRNGRTNWQVPGIDESRFSARRWTAQQESAAGLTPEEENWDVIFRSPRAAPVEIRASRSTRLVGPTPVCLASLPDAAKLQGTLIVRSLGPEIIKIATHRLRAQPADSARPDLVQTLRGSYRYDPRSEAASQSDPAMVLTAEGAESAAAWVWDCEIRSQFAASGAADHFVTYRIQNGGSRQVRLALPDGLVCRDVHGAFLNDRPADLNAADPAAGELTIDLPADAKFVTLAVQLSSRGAPLGMMNRLRPVLPDIGLPIFATRWVVDLPPGYEACGHAGESRNGAAAPLSASRRLFGFLASDQHQSPFNPLRLDDWRLALGGENVQSRSDSQEAAGASRAQCTIDLGHGEPSLVVVRKAAVGAASWLLFLAVVGAGAWKSLNRPLVLLILAVIFGLPALLLPVEISVVFSHGLLGVFFCMALALIRRREAVTGEPASVRRNEIASTLTNVLPFGAPVLAIALLGCWEPAKAGESSPSPPTYSVFIPVNEKQQPAKGKYFLPEPFFAELYRRDASHAEKPQAWMITSAVYRAALTDDAAHAGHVIDRLTAEFDVRVFNAAAHVNIPVRRNEVSLEPGQARLDDRSIQPEWAADGNALLLDIAEPGEYRLELALRPVSLGESPASGIELAIPRVPTSLLELAVAAGAPQIEFPSALGEVRREEAQSRWTVELGPADRLAVRWPEDNAAEPAVVDVEQSLWLKIEPGCVLLDARMKATPANGPLRRLLVRADSALELLPALGLAGPTVLARGGGEMSKTYEVDWPATASPAGGSATFDLHFLWRGAASLGTLHVPQIDVVDAPPARKSLAVSIDPGIECQAPAARSQETGTVAEFMLHWGLSKSLPDMAFRLNGNAADWSLTTRARRSETTGDQTVTWSFGKEFAQVQLDALLLTASGSLYQYRVEAPPGLRVDKVTSLADGAPRAVRWSQEPDGRIRVFPTVPVSGRHEIHLHGHVPITMRRKMLLPAVRLEDVRLQSSQIGIYRRPDVLVDVSAAGELADVKAPPGETGQADRGRLLRLFNADSAATSQVAATVYPNHPRVRCEQITRTASEENRWRTECEFHLQVSGGQLDAIELNVPASWQEGIKTAPPMAAAIAANSDDRATLVLAPSAAISGDFTLTLAGPPAPSTGFAVPNVTMKKAQILKRSVVLPDSAADRPVGWARQNLRPDRTANAAHRDPDNTARYEVLGEPWQALLLRPRRPAAATRVVQCEVRYAWQTDGRCLGAAFLDVESAAAIDVPLSLPEGFQLIQLTVDGLPVDAIRGPTGAWSVPLAMLGSTTRVELLFFAESPPPLSASTRSHKFVAPKLGDLPVERTLWTVAAPPTFQLRDGAAGQLEMPPDSAAALPAGNLAQRWQEFVRDGRLLTFHAVAGPNDALTLDYRPTGAESWLSRLAGIAGFLAIAWLAALLIRRGLLSSWFARWPLLFGVAFGLAWWLWLSPSALGLVIALLVVFRHFPILLRRSPAIAPARGPRPRAPVAPARPGTGPSWPA